MSGLSDAQSHRHQQPTDHPSRTNLDQHEIYVDSLPQDSLDCIQQFHAKPTPVYLRFDQLHLPPQIPRIVRHDPPPDESSQVFSLESTTTSNEHLYTPSIYLVNPSLYRLTLTLTKVLISLEDLTCSICLSLFEQPITLPCSHSLCYSCVENLFVENRRLFKLGLIKSSTTAGCPYCKAPFSQRDCQSDNIDAVLSKTVRNTINLFYLLVRSYEYEAQFEIDLRQHYLQHNQSVWTLHGPASDDYVYPMSDSTTQNENSHQDDEGKETNPKKINAATEWRLKIEIPVIKTKVESTHEATRNKHKKRGSSSAASSSLFLSLPTWLQHNLFLLRQQYDTIQQRAIREFHPDGDHSEKPVLSITEIASTSVAIVPSLSSLTYQQECYRQSMEQLETSSGSTSVPDLPSWVDRHQLSSRLAEDHTPDEIPIDASTLAQEMNIQHQRQKNYSRGFMASYHDASADPTPSTHDNTKESRSAEVDYTKLIEQEELKIRTLVAEIEELSRIEREMRQSRHLHHHQSGTSFMNAADLQNVSSDGKTRGQTSTVAPAQGFAQVLSPIFLHQLAVEHGGSTSPHGTNSPSHQTPSTSKTATPSSSAHKQQRRSRSKLSSVEALKFSTASTPSSSRFLPPDMKDGEDGIHSDSGSQQDSTLSQWDTLTVEATLPTMIRRWSYICTNWADLPYTGMYDALEYDEMYAVDPILTISSRSRGQTTSPPNTTSVSVGDGADTSHSTDEQDQMVDDDVFDALPIDNTQDVDRDPLRPPTQKKTLTPTKASHPENRPANQSYSISSMDNILPASRIIISLLFWNHVRILRHAELNPEVSKDYSNHHGQAAVSTYNYQLALVNPLLALLKIKTSPLDTVLPIVHLIRFLPWSFFYSAIVKLDPSNHNAFRSWYLSRDLVDDLEQDDSNTQGSQAKGKGQTVSKRTPASSSVKRKGKKTSLTSAEHQQGDAAYETILRTHDQLIVRTKGLTMSVFGAASPLFSLFFHYKHLTEQGACQSYGDGTSLKIKPTTLPMSFILMTILESSHPLFLAQQCLLANTWSQHLNSQTGGLTDKHSRKGSNLDHPLGGALEPLLSHTRSILQTLTSETSQDESISTGSRQSSKSKTPQKTSQKPTEMSSVLPLFHDSFPIPSSYYTNCHVCQQRGHTKWWYDDSDGLRALAAPDVIQGSDSFSQQQGENPPSDQPLAKAKDYPLPIKGDGHTIYVDSLSDVQRQVLLSAQNCGPRSQWSASSPMMQQQQQQHDQILLGTDQNDSNSHTFNPYDHTFPLYYMLRCCSCDLSVHSTCYGVGGRWIPMMAQPSAPMDLTHAEHSLYSSAPTIPSHTTPMTGMGDTSDEIVPVGATSDSSLLSSPIEMATYIDGWQWQCLYCFHRNNMLYYNAYWLRANSIGGNIAYHRLIDPNILPPLPHTRKIVYTYMMAHFEQRRLPLMSNSVNGENTCDAAKMISGNIPLCVDLPQVTFPSMCAICPLTLSLAIKPLIYWDEHEVMNPTPAAGDATAHQDIRLLQSSLDMGMNPSPADRSVGQHPISRTMQEVCSNKRLYRQLINSSNREASHRQERSDTGRSGRTLGTTYPYQQFIAEDTDSLLDAIEHSQPITPAKSANKRASIEKDMENEDDDEDEELVPILFSRFSGPVTPHNPQEAVPLNKTERHRKLLVHQGYSVVKSYQRYVQFYDYLTYYNSDLQELIRGMEAQLEQDAMDTSRIQRHIDILQTHLASLQLGTSTEHPSPNFNDNSENHSGNSSQTDDAPVYTHHRYYGDIAHDFEVDSNISSLDEDEMFAVMDKSDTTVQQYIKHLLHYLLRAMLPILSIPEDVQVNADHSPAHPSIETLLYQHISHYVQRIPPPLSYPPNHLNPYSFFWFNMVTSAYNYHDAPILTNAIRLSNTSSSLASPDSQFGSVADDTQCMKDYQTLGVPQHLSGYPPCPIPSMEECIVFELVKVIPTISAYITHDLDQLTQEPMMTALSDEMDTLLDNIVQRVQQYSSRFAQFNAKQREYEYHDDDRASPLQSVLTQEGIDQGLHSMSTHMPPTLQLETFFPPPLVVPPIPLYWTHITCGTWHNEMTIKKGEGLVDIVCKEVHRDKFRSLTCQLCRVSGTDTTYTRPDAPAACDIVESIHRVNYDHHRCEHSSNSSQDSDHMHPVETWHMPLQSAVVNYPVIIPSLPWVLPLPLFSSQQTAGHDSLSSAPQLIPFSLSSDDDINNHSLLFSNLLILLPNASRFIQPLESAFSNTSNSSSPLNTTSHPTTSGSPSVPSTQTIIMSIDIPRLLSWSHSSDALDTLQHATPWKIQELALNTLHGSAQLLSMPQIDSNCTAVLLSQPQECTHPVDHANRVLLYQPFHDILSTLTLDRTSATQMPSLTSHCLPSLEHPTSPTAQSQLKELLNLALDSQNTTSNSSDGRTVTDQALSSNLKSLVTIYDNISKFLRDTKPNSPSKTPRWSDHGSFLLYVLTVLFAQSKVLSHAILFHIPVMNPAIAPPRILIHHTDQQKPQGAGRRGGSTKSSSKNARNALSSLTSAKTKLLSHPYYRQYLQSYTTRLRSPQDHSLLIELEDHAISILSALDHGSSSSAIPSFPKHDSGEDMSDGDEQPIILASLITIQSYLVDTFSWLSQSHDDDDGVQPLRFAPTPSLYASYTPPSLYEQRQMESLGQVMSDENNIPSIPSLLRIPGLFFTSAGDISTHNYLLDLPTNITSSRGGDPPINEWLFPINTHQITTTITLSNHIATPPAQTDHAATATNPLVSQSTPMYIQSYTFSSPYSILYAAESHHNHFFRLLQRCMGTTVQLQHLLPPQSDVICLLKPPFQGVMLQCVFPNCTESYHPSCGVFTQSVLFKTKESFFGVHKHNYCPKHRHRESEVRPEVTMPKDLLKKLQKEYEKQLERQQVDMPAVIDTPGSVSVKSSSKRKRSLAGHESDNASSMDPRRLNVDEDDNSTDDDDDDSDTMRDSTHPQGSLSRQVQRAVPGSSTTVVVTHDISTSTLHPMPRSSSAVVVSFGNISVDQLSQEINRFITLAIPADRDNPVDQSHHTSGSDAGANDKQTEHHDDGNENDDEAEFQAKRQRQNATTRDTRSLGGHDNDSDVENVPLNLRRPSDIFFMLPVTSPHLWSHSFLENLQGFNARNGATTDLIDKYQVDKICPKTVSKAAEQLTHFLTQPITSTQHEAIAKLPTVKDSLPFLRSLLRYRLQLRQTQPKCYQQPLSDPLIEAYAGLLPKSLLKAFTPPEPPQSNANVGSFNSNRLIAREEHVWSTTMQDKQGVNSDQHQQGVQPESPLVLTFGSTRLTEQQRCVLLLLCRLLNIAYGCVLFQCDHTDSTTSFAASDASQAQRQSEKVDRRPMMKIIYCAECCGQCDIIVCSAYSRFSFQSIAYPSLMLSLLERDADRALAANSALQTHHTHPLSVSVFLTLFLHLASTQIMSTETHKDLLKLVDMSSTAVSFPSVTSTLQSAEPSQHTAASTATGNQYVQDHVILFNIPTTIASPHVCTGRTIKYTAGKTRVLSAALSFPRDGSIPSSSSSSLGCNTGKIPYLVCFDYVLACLASLSLLPPHHFAVLEQLDMFPLWFQTMGDSHSSLSSTPSINSISPLPLAYGLSHLYDQVNRSSLSLPLSLPRPLPLRGLQRESIGGLHGLSMQKLTTMITVIYCHDYIRWLYNQQQQHQQTGKQTPRDIYLMITPSSLQVSNDLNSTTYHDEQQLLVLPEATLEAAFPRESQHSQHSRTRFYPISIHFIQLASHLLFTALSDAFPSTLAAQEQLKNSLQKTVSQTSQLLEKRRRTVDPLRVYQDPTSYLLDAMQALVQSAKESNGTGMQLYGSILPSPRMLSQLPFIREDSEIGHHGGMTDEDSPATVYQSIYFLLCQIYSQYILARSSLDHILLSAVTHCTDLPPPLVAQQLLIIEVPAWRRTPMETSLSFLIHATAIRHLSCSPQQDDPVLIPGVFGFHYPRVFPPIPRVAVGITTQPPNDTSPVNCVSILSAPTAVGSRQWSGSERATSSFDNIEAIPPAMQSDWNRLCIWVVDSQNISTTPASISTTAATISPSFDVSALLKDYFSTFISPPSDVASPTRHVDRNWQAWLALHGLAVQPDRNVDQKKARPPSGGPSFDDIRTFLEPYNPILVDCTHHIALVHCQMEWIASLMTHVHACTSCYNTLLSFRGIVDRTTTFANINSSVEDQRCVYICNTLLNQQVLCSPSIIVDIATTSQVTTPSTDGTSDVSPAFKSAFNQMLAKSPPLSISNPAISKSTEDSMADLTTTISVDGTAVPPTASLCHRSMFHLIQTTLSPAQPGCKSPMISGREYARWFQRHQQLWNSHSIPGNYPFLMPPHSLMAHLVHFVYLNSIVQRSLSGLTKPWYTSLLCATASAQSTRQPGDQPPTWAAPLSPPTTLHQMGAQISPFYTDLNHGHVAPHVALHLCSLLPSVPPLDIIQAPLTNLKYLIQSALFTTPIPMMRVSPPMPSSEK